MPAKQGFNNKDAKPVHLTWEECQVLYPRIAKCLQWALIASTTEAACCLRDYIDGHSFGGEVVSHAGRSPAQAIRQAIRFEARTAARRERRGVLFVNTAESIANVRKVRRAVRIIKTGKRDVLHLSFAEPAPVGA